MEAILAFNVSLCKESQECNRNLRKTTEEDMCAEAIVVTLVESGGSLEMCLQIHKGLFRNSKCLPHYLYVVNVVGWCCFCHKQLEKDD